MENAGSSGSANRFSGRRLSPPELTMCQRITCNSCGKPTWAGCGAHVEAALAGVPKDKRCTCREQRSGNKQSSGSRNGQTRKP